MKHRKIKFLKGVIKRHSDGYAFFIHELKKHPDVYIPSGNLGSALTNDYVEISVSGKRSNYGAMVGQLEKIIKRHHEFAVGPVDLLGSQLVINDHNLNYKKSVLLENPKEIEVKPKQWVKAKITQYADDHNIFKAEITENLGEITSTAKDDNKRALAEFNISLTFPDEVLKELDEFPDEVSEKDFKDDPDRVDLRYKNFVTIDGVTAKDFDDAIYVEKHDFGYKLFVAIADVSHYVKIGSSLEQEALSRGNSTYLPNFCVPMLPEKLSNGLCSLNPLVPRLVMVCEMDYDFQGEFMNSKVYNAVITSKKRLTYGKVQEMLDGFEDFTDLPEIENANHLAKILLKKHYQDGALNLNIKESTVVINDAGEPVEFVKEERLFSHQMIEQFMLAANKAVSLFLEKHNASFMYRIHEEPKKDKMAQLQSYAKFLSFPDDVDSRKSLIKFLSQFRGDEKEEIANKLILRTLSQARYSANNKGHYGLNFEKYTHFTSPIRRYCDLSIHRTIKKCLKNSPVRTPEKDIEAQATYISEKEQNSVKAERLVKDVKRARFLSAHIGESFKGTISTITSFGIFVSLKDYDIEGLIRFKDMPGLWFSDDAGLRATARGSGFSLQFGKEVEIRVTASNPMNKNIDFELLKYEDTNFVAKKEEFKKGAGDRRGSDRGRGSSRGRSSGRDSGRGRGASGKRGSGRDSDRRSSGRGRDSDRGGSGRGSYGKKILEEILTEEVLAEEVTAKRFDKEFERDLEREFERDLERDSERNSRRRKKFEKGGRKNSGKKEITVKENQREVLMTEEVLAEEEILTEEVLAEEEVLTKKEVTEKEVLKEVLMTEEVLAEEEALTKKEVTEKEVLKEVLMTEEVLAEEEALTKKEVTEKEVLKNPKVLKIKKKVLKKA